MIFRGVNPENVCVTGIPIRLEFEHAEVQAPSPISMPLRILVIAGGIRGGSYTEVKQYLLDLLDGLGDIDPGKLKVTIVTGKDHRLRERLEEHAVSSPVDIQVRGFVNHMYALMRDHDVIIGKPGGLIVSEALACGICMILFKPGPGQESANVDFLARHGIAFRGETVSEVIQVLHQCVAIPNQVQEMKMRSRALGQPKAAAEISRRILEET
jgi:processive 1,2-diacylglycerol beta-glucosyltransferase